MLGMVPTVSMADNTLNNEREMFLFIIVFSFYAVTAIISVAVAVVAEELIHSEQ
jgi:hypothetical protein